MTDRTDLLEIPPRINGKRQPLVDVQASHDSRGVAIDKVGIKGLRFPIRVLSRDDIEQSCAATVDFYVNLPADERGTHMSRFVELLQQQEAPWTASRVLEICRAARSRLSATQSFLELEFEYFVHKKAPITGAVGPLNYRVAMAGQSGAADDLVLSVRAPATSLCPCSRQLADYGAHNQRCEIEARVRVRGELWIEDLIDAIEAAASSQVYSILKRPDEKRVTERAYENPKFVEDVVRDVALVLQADDRIAWYSVSSENFESIHNHNAYAQIERDKRSPADAAGCLAASEEV